MRVDVLNQTPDLERMYTVDRLNKALARLYVEK